MHTLILHGSLRLQLYFMWSWSPLPATCPPSQCSYEEDDAFVHHAAISDYVKFSSFSNDLTFPVSNCERMFGRQVQRSSMHTQSAAQIFSCAGSSSLTSISSVRLGRSDYSISLGSFSVSCSSKTLVSYILVLWSNMCLVKNVQSTCFCARFWLPCCQEGTCSL